MTQDTKNRPFAAAPQGAAARLSFLDALRGVAALAVALGHRAESTFTDFAHLDEHFFRLGQFGVVAFFLCSGFIIPASLERNGSLRRFWKGRFFRLYPLYWMALAIVLVLALLGLYGLPPGYSADATTNTLVNATMAQALVGAPLAIGLSWTLGYELGFYVVMSLLFALGLHRFTRSLAGIWAFLAFGLGLLNLGLPAIALPLLGIVSLVSAGAAWRYAKRGPRLVAGAALAVVVAALVFNRHGEAWLNTALLASMFAGTVLYRHFSGTLSIRAAWFAYAGVAALVCTTVLLNARSVSWAVTFTAAFAVFGLLYAWRRLRFPRPLVFLGTISYSIYLLHPAVFVLVPHTPGFPLAGFALAMAVTVMVAACTYRWVEVPMIALGRRTFSRR